MPGTKSRWRRILVLIGICTILLGLVLVAMPVWFPWLARPVARSIGFEFESYRHLGLTRFELTGVRGRLENVEVTVDRLEAFLPHRWLWERWMPGVRTGGYVSATDWVVRVDRRGESEPPKSRGQSTFELLNEVDGIAQILRTWVPSARLRNGTVDVQGLSADIPKADWSAGRFEVQARAPELPSPVWARLDVTRSGRWPMELEGVMPGAGLKGQWVRTESSWDFEGTLEWRANHVGMFARFDQSGWLPVEADISGAKLGIPSEAVGVPHYGQLHGEFNLHWLDGEYTLQIQGAAEPGTAASNEVWPRLEFGLSGHGDMESATIEELQARAPWFTFGMRDPSTVILPDLELAEPAFVEIRAELAGLNPGWSGVAHAELEVRSGANLYPAVAFRVWGEEFSAGDIVLFDLEGNGSFDWPLIELERGTARLGSNSVAHVWGELDLRRNELASAGLEWEGDDVRRFLPEWIEVNGLQARMSAEGPLTRLRHEGEVQVEQLVTSQVNPTTVALRWNGEALDLEAFEVSARAGDSRLVIGGEAQGAVLPSVAVQAQLNTLTLEREGVAVYRLDEPVRLQWEDQGKSEWQAAIDSWVWKGEGGRSLVLTGEVHWPMDGQARLEARQTLLSDVRDFWPGPDLELTVSTLDILAGWTNGPMVWQMEVEASAGRSDDDPWVIGARARGDEAGIVVETLALGGMEVPTVAIRGSLPLVLQISGSPFVRILPEGAFELAASNPVADVIRLALGGGDHLELFEPELDLRVTGTVDRPEGQIRAALSRASWQSSQLGAASPRVEHLRMEVEVRPDLIRLNRLEFELEGQPVVVQGAWPLGTYAWNKLFAEGTVPGWEDASGRVLIEGADLAPVARHLPTLLTTQGKLNLDLSIQPGLMLEGFLALTNAMTRPLGPLSPVRDIEAMIAFSGTTARVDRFAARLGGRAIQVSGHAALSESRELLYSLRLQATNAPLVREPGLLMRANLDLSLETKSGQNPMITGAVQLRDGLLLQDVSSLLVDRLERPALRPPYFSITNLPFARWQLDVKVTGDRFLRVRSPAFVGAVSTDGAVQGSLAKPVIKADVRLPSGRILFPFGKLEVEGAYATLSGEEPRGPKIDLVAAGQNYGYNVRLEVTGTMDDLHVLFTSTPPLSSEEILLMLTAGELPSQEISYSAEARAGRLITYLGREVVTRFFGDEMGEERLIINSGENVARSGRTTYSVEYRLTPRWSLVGEYDQFNALNAGLKWRIYSR